jgi:hypothetical protein
VDELDCHIFVDVVFTVSIFTYLYKYLYKGPDRAHFNIARQNEDRVDELNDYVEGRYLPAHEAAWRILGFHITSKTPAVACLPLHLPNKNVPRFSGGTSNSKPSTTLLIRYFACPLNPTFDNITYTDYFKDFVLYKASAEELTSPNVFVEQVIANCPVNKVSPRQIGLKVTRIQMISPTAGELFYLRALLLHRPARSYEALRTVDGSVYTTFHDAAVHFGLFSNENEAQFALHEGVLSLITPHQLRFLFARVVLEGYPAAALWEEFKLELAADFIARTQSQEQGLNAALQSLSQSVREGGRKLSHFGLPEPARNARETIIERETFSSRASELRNSASRQANTMNAEQKQVFSTIVECTTTYGQTHSTALSPFFLEGKPGRGKTFVINAVANHLRAGAHIVLIVGSSALAATLYEGGRTAHNLFQIPVTDVRTVLAPFLAHTLNLHFRRQTSPFNRQYARFQSAQN